MKVQDLKPGDLFQSLVGTMAGEEWVFIGLVEQHPVWSRFSLVIWIRVGDGKISLDALDRRQEVGESFRTLGQDELRALMTG